MRFYLIEAWLDNCVIRQADGELFLGRQLYIKYLFRAEAVTT